MKTIARDTWRTISFLYATTLLNRFELDWQTSRLNINMCW